MTFTRSQVRPGMAYFLGTGPKGAICGNCESFGADGEYWRGEDRRCDMYRRLTGKLGARIAPDYRACKYFSEKVDAQ